MGPDELVGGPPYECGALNWSIPVHGLIPQSLYSNAGGGLERPPNLGVIDVYLLRNRNQNSLPDGPRCQR